MDPATIALIELGLTTAGTWLDRFAGAARAPRPHELQEFVASTVARLEAAGGPGADDAAGAERMEQLVSRARNLSDLLEMDRPQQAVQYAMTLRESTDYARNRIDEGRAYWIGPYLAGSSVYFATLYAAGERREADLAEFRGDAEQIRAMILDDVVPAMLRRGVKVPWVTVAEFVRGGAAAVPEVLGHLRMDAGAPSAAAPPADPGVPSLPGVDPDIHALAMEILDPVTGAFVAPLIPQGKIDGAKKKVLSLADSGDALVALVDLTAFGGARECVAVFSRYCVIGSQGALLRLEYAHLPAVITYDGYYLEMGGERYFMLERARAAAVCDFLNAAHARALAG